MPIGVTDADAVAEGIFPHADSLSGTGTHIIDCMKLSFMQMIYFE
jgi:hypothetical protein